MRLISIRDEPRTKRKILTFADGKTMKTTGTVLAESGVFSEGELSEQEYRTLLANAGRASAQERAVRIVAAASVSERELVRRLVQKGETEDNAQAAADWMTELGLLDDAKTASELVSSAVRKGYGENRIRAILREKGIPQELWTQALSEIPAMDDAIDRYLHRTLDGTDADDRLVKKATEALLRRGHSWGAIRDGLRRYREDLDFSDTMEEPI